MMYFYLLDFAQFQSIDSEIYCYYSNFIFYHASFEDIIIIFKVVYVTEFEINCHF